MNGAAAPIHERNHHRAFFLQWLLAVFPYIDRCLVLAEICCCHSLFLGLLRFFRFAVAVSFFMSGHLFASKFPWVEDWTRCLEVLRSSNRVPADDDPIDQICHGMMLFRFACACDGILMGRRGVAKKAKNFALGEKATIIHGEQERLADGQRRLACWFACLGHRIFPFLHREPAW